MDGEEGLIMSHSPLFSQLARLMRIANWCEREGVPTSEGLVIADEVEATGRRQFLARAGAYAVGSAVASVVSPRSNVFAGPAPSIGIVGAGLAGLACADTLKVKGLLAAIYDANNRP